MRVNDNVAASSAAGRTVIIEVVRSLTRAEELGHRVVDGRIYGGVIGSASLNGGLYHATVIFDDALPIHRIGNHRIINSFLASHGFGSIYRVFNIESNPVVKSGTISIGKIVVAAPYKIINLFGVRIFNPLIRNWDRYVDVINGDRVGWYIGRVTLDARRNSNGTYTTYGYTHLSSIPPHPHESIGGALCFNFDARTLVGVLINSGKYEDAAVAFCETMRLINPRDCYRNYETMFGRSFCVECNREVFEPRRCASCGARYCPECWPSEEMACPTCETERTAFIYRGSPNAVATDEQIVDFMLNQQPAIDREIEQAAQEARRIEEQARTNIETCDRIGGHVGTGELMMLRRGAAGLRRYMTCECEVCRIQREQINAYMERIHGGPPPQSEEFDTASGMLYAERFHTAAILVEEIARHGQAGNAETTQRTCERCFELLFSRQDVGMRRIVDHVLFGYDLPPTREEREEQERRRLAEMRREIMERISSIEPNLALAELIRLHNTGLGVEDARSFASMLRPSLDYSVRRAILAEYMLLKHGGDLIAASGELLNQSSGWDTAIARFSTFSFLCAVAVFIATNCNIIDATEYISYGDMAAGMTRANCGEAVERLHEIISLGQLRLLATGNRGLCTQVCKFILHRMMLGRVDNELVQSYLERSTSRSLESVGIPNDVRWNVECVTMRFERGPFPEGFQYENAPGEFSTSFYERHSPIEDEEEGASELEGIQSFTVGNIRFEAYPSYSDSSGSENNPFSIDWMNAGRPES